MSDFVFKIDGVAIPTPSSYKAGIEDLSSEATGRTLDGVMHKDVVDEKDYYDCTWKSLSWQDTATLLGAIRKKEQFQFTHASPYTPNEFITEAFYVGERSTAALNLNDPNKTWTDISFRFIKI